MVMDFWQAKRRARNKTRLYLTLFILLTMVAATVLEFGIRYYAGDAYSPNLPLFGALFLALTFTAAFVQYLIYRSSGGKFVAESMGARLADPANSLKEQELLNIVQECAIGASLPVPPVYIIDAQEINAFAAGLSADSAVIAVTEGALTQLTRDELQAVIAHEFGHVANGDMVIGLRLAAMLMGFYFILYLGLRIFQFAGMRRTDSRNASVIVLLALTFVIAGAFAWLFGSILKAAVSRQREYLADASSVQFTRNPQGLIGALKKIENESARDMPDTAMAYSHLYFDARGAFSALFATHPPLKKRIEALEGK